MTATLRAANAVGPLASATFQLSGLRRPAGAVPGRETSPLAEFWVQFAAARTLPLTAALLWELSRSRSSALPALLVVAGLALVCDAVVGARQRNVPMAIVTAAMGGLHLITARRIGSRCWWAADCG